MRRALTCIEFAFYTVIPSVACSQAGSALAAPELVNFAELPASLNSAFMALEEMGDGALGIMVRAGLSPCGPYALFGSWRVMRI
jgi:hypothetical protein